MRKTFWFRNSARASGRRKSDSWLPFLALLTLLASGSFLFIFREHIFGPFEHVVLSLRGSTSLGDELVPQLAVAFLRDEMGQNEQALGSLAKTPTDIPTYTYGGRFREDLGYR